MSAFKKLNESMELLELLLERADTHIIKARSELEEIKYFLTYALEEAKDDKETD